MQLLEEIREAVQTATPKKNRTVMIHYQALVNAKKLQNVSGEEFCEAVGIAKTFATEFRKMMRLASFIEEQGKMIRDI